MKKSEANSKSFHRRRSIAKARYATALVCVAMVWAACSGGSSDSTDAGDAGEPAPIRISVYTGSIWSMPLFIAEEKGFFEDNNLDAELVPVSDGPSAIAALGANSVDVLSMEPMVTLPAIQQGVDMKVIAGAMSMPWEIVFNDSFDGPTTYPDNIKALSGGKFGVIGLGTNSEVMANAIFENGGASLDDVTLVAVGNGPPAAAALIGDEVDAVITAPPIGALVQAQGGGQTLVDFSSTPGALPGDLGSIPDQGQWASTRFIDESPEAVDGFRRAMAEAIAWMQDPANVGEVEEFFTSTFDNEELSPAMGDLVEQMVPKYTAAYGVDHLQAWHDFDIEWGLLEEPMDVESLVAEGTPADAEAVAQLLSEG